MATGLALIIYVTDPKRENLNFKVVDLTENPVISKYIEKQFEQNNLRMKIMNSQMINLSTISVNLTKLNTCPSTMILADEILSKEPHSVTS